MQKIIYIVIVLLMLTSSLEAIDKYNCGDTLFVWASSGLSLRETAALDANKISVLAYGTAIVTLGGKGRKDEMGSFFVDELPKTKDFVGLKIRGNWAKVRFETTIGYVFDGYLSYLKPKVIVPKYTDPGGAWFRCAHEETLFEYAKRVFPMCLLDESDGEYAICWTMTKTMEKFLMN